MPGHECPDCEALRTPYGSLLDLGWNLDDSAKGVLIDQDLRSLMDADEISSFDDNIHSAQPDPLPHLCFLQSALDQPEKVSRADPRWFCMYSAYCSSAACSGPRLGILFFNRHGGIFRVELTNSSTIARNCSSNERERYNATTS